MLKSFAEILRCPITKSKLTLHVISEKSKDLDGNGVTVIDEGILFSDEFWFYPIIDGVPRLMPEAILYYEDFFQRNLINYSEKRKLLFENFGYLISLNYKKNKRTLLSYTKQWFFFSHEKDRTWKADNQQMINTFITETSESISTLQGKLILDAGCGNGVLNSLLAKEGVGNIGIDLSKSVEKAYCQNKYSKAQFVQGDLQYPPFETDFFEVVHSSGVLHHTNNTELTLSCILPLVKQKGKISIWLYQPRKNFIHNFFNFIRKWTSKLPYVIQYYLYLFTLFPISFIIKKMKGNSETPREMFVSILDWFSPEFRWEHSREEASAWLSKRDFKKITVTDEQFWGFNIIGEKK